MGCGASTSAAAEAYQPPPDAAAEKRASEKSDAGAVQRSSEESGGSKGNKSNAKNSKRNSTQGNETEEAALKATEKRKKSEVEETASSGASAAEKPMLPKVQPRRKSTAENLCEMTLSQSEVCPFSQVEVRWKLLKTMKANEADWIGMYEGVEVPEDIDNYVSSMMATGKPAGTVKFTAPNHPGLHHFRYFLLDDTEAAVSEAFTITKMDKKEVEDNIHVRDAISAENEVKRIEGTFIDDEEEEEELNPAQPGERKKKKKEVPKDFDDVTGFQVDENSTSTSAEEFEKWKEEAQQANAAKEEQVMHAATNYVKKIPTKKEMRADAAKKVAATQNSAGVAAPASQPTRTSTETPEESGTGQKKPGWGALRSAVKNGAGAFQQGRANKTDDKTRKKPAKPKAGGGGADDMGSFTMVRGKK